jgi:hypothetical protein
MPTPPHTLQCSEPDRKTLEGVGAEPNTGSAPGGAGQDHPAMRAGARGSDIARRLRVRPNTVIDWRRRFEREGVTGLADRPRPGKPRRYGTDFRTQVLGRVGSTTAEWTSRLGRSRSGPASQDIRACGLACAAQGRRLPGPAA